jgi:predicted peroxiredoxin
MSDKFLIVIHAGPDDIGKAFHGLTYGQELHEEGYEVKIYFDGLGPTWIKELNNPSHIFHSVFKEVQKLGIISGSCGYCTSFLKVDEEANAAGVFLVGGTKDGHFSFVEHIKEGYTPIII